MKVPLNTNQPTYLKLRRGLRIRVQNGANPYASLRGWSCDVKPCDKQPQRQLQLRCDWTTAGLTSRMTQQVCRGRSRGSLAAIEKRRQRNKELKKNPTEHKHRCRSSPMRLAYCNIYTCHRSDFVNFPNPILFTFVMIQ